MSVVDEIWTPAVTGAVAGLGVAMPLGAVAVLLLREGLVNGFRVVAASAAGVATVDLLYSAVAMVTGALLTRMIVDRRGLFLVVSGAAIVAIGVRQLHQGLIDRARTTGEVTRVSALAAYARFVGLTAINPMTMVYFVALSGAVTAPDSSWVTPVVFVAAVGLSSLAWQLALAMVGSFFGGVVTDNTTRMIGIAASLLIVALGAGVLVTGAGWPTTG